MFLNINGNTLMNCGLSICKNDFFDISYTFGPNDRYIKNVIDYIMK